MPKSKKQETVRDLPFSEPLKFVKDLEILLDYYWEEERKHCEENPNRRHIFHTMKRLSKTAKFLKELI